MEASFSEEVRSLWKSNLHSRTEIADADGFANMTGFIDGLMACSSVFTETRVGI
jgi:hypothetical protein